MCSHASVIPLPAYPDTLYNMEKLFGVGPDCESYRLVIGMCIKLDQINTAYDVWEYMHTTLPGSAHDKGTYKHLMYGCQKYVGSQTKQLAHVCWYSYTAWHCTAGWERTSSWCALRQGWLGLGLFPRPPS